jgi:FAD/FMN-containing dehydrogenase
MLAETYPQTPCPLPACLLSEVAQIKSVHLGLNGNQCLRLQPQTEGALAAVFRVAQEQGQDVVLSLNDALAHPAAWLVDVAALTQVTEYQVEDLVLSVQTGLSFGELEALLATNNHCLPITYPKHWSLADVLAMDTASLNAGLRRTLKEYVLGLRFAGADGVVSFSGGKVVKNVTGYDLHKFYVGSLYSLGVPTEVTLRLAAKPQGNRAYGISFSSWAEAFTFSQNLLALPDSVLAAFELIDAKALPEALSACFQSETPHAVWAYLACDGPEVLLQLFEEQLKSKHPALLTFTLAEKERLETSLMLWGDVGNNTTLKVDAGLPWGGWLPSVQQVLAAQGDLRLQVRPAIGLLQLAFNLKKEGLVLELMQAIEALKTQVQQAGGWLQVTQVPAANDAWAQSLNKPNQAAEWNLLQRLKGTYDPKGLIKTRRMGL